MRLAALRLRVGCFAAAAALVMAAPAAGGGRTAIHKVDTGASATLRSAAGRLEIRRVDTNGYPLVRTLVVVPPGEEAPPTLRVQGGGASGVSAENLAGRETIALLIDRSQAMRGTGLSDAIQAARAFVAGSPASDRIGVTGFASRAVTLAGYSSGGAGIDAALQSLTVDPQAGSALWGSVARIADSLRRHPPAGRVIVLLTAGRDTAKTPTLQDAIRAARLAHVAVYTVGIPSRLFVNGRWITLGHRWYTPHPLQQLAAATGGTFYAAPSSAALPGIYRAISAELRRTWQLSFYIAARPGDTLTLQLQAGHDHANAHLRLASPTHVTGAATPTLLLAVIAVLAALSLIFIVPTLRRLLT